MSENDNVKSLIRGILAKQKEDRPLASKPQARPAPKAQEKPKRQPRSEDAMDHRNTRGKFSKAEKREYARKMHEEALIQPPKDPPPAWLNDPSLLPKRPPGRTED